MSIKEKWVQETMKKKEVSYYEVWRNILQM